MQQLKNWQNTDFNKIALNVHLIRTNTKNPNYSEFFKWNILSFTFQNRYKQAVDAEDILPIDGAELYLDVADWHTEWEQNDVVSQKVRHCNENVTQRQKFYVKLCIESCQQTT